MTEERKEDKINWFSYGQLKSPFERLGLDETLYKEQKKKELFTDTKNYLTSRNTLLQTMMPEINNLWKKQMDSPQLQSIPISERTRLADKMAVSMANQFKQIVEELYPNADMAYKQQSNNIIAENIVAGNIAKMPNEAKTKKKRGGRPKGSRNKSKKDKK